MKAILKNYRQSPRKVRLVADMVRGKSVEHALTALDFLDRKVALPMKKLIESAIANAEHTGVAKADELTVGTITVDSGLSFTRFRPRARGRAFPLKKRTSSVTVVLDTKKEKVK
jgi:large subunit ribosomal protein L22